jgi:hypothetical protein
MATALVRYMEQPEEIHVNGKRYTFEVRRGVSLCMVDEVDVPAVLGISRMCCGGQRRRKFLTANQAQIDVWHT